MFENDSTIHSKSFGRSSRFLACSAIAGMVLTLCQGIFAGEPVAEDKTPHVLESGLLMLDNGKIVQGRITHEGGEFRVQKSRGEMFVPETMVVHVCENMHDAYLKKRDDVKKPTAADHVVLARWCLSYNLLEEAQTELQQAVKLEPGRIQSRRMLRRLDAMLGGGTDPGMDDDSTSSPKFSGLDYDVESLGGLSRDDAQQFTSRIQPILVNTCANARCHANSSSDNGFALMRVKVGRHSSRLGTQRNLAEVLKQINFNDPQNSPLFTAIEEKHRGNKLLFRGRSGQSQLDELREWVANVADAKTGRTLAKTELKQKLNRTLTRQAAATSSKSGKSFVEQVGTGQSRILIDPTDPFNPINFNQQPASR